MKVSGKMYFTIILKVTKNQGFSLCLEDTIFEKPQGGGGSIWPPPHSRFSVKQSSRGVLQKKRSWKFFMIHRRTHVLKYLFNKVTGQRPAALSKRDSRIGVFPWILPDILEHLFCIWLSLLYKISVLRNLTKFTAKFMWIAVSGISEIRPCLANLDFQENVKGNFWI